MFGGMHRLWKQAIPMVLTLSVFIGVGVVLHACFPAVAYAQEDFKWSQSLVTFIVSILVDFVNWIGNMAGSLTLVILEVVVVNVLNYNNFSSSTIVTLGWTLTRDVVNMFAVIVLLIMAVKAMVGQGGNAWQQHLPRFFLGIVAANFSRTICGLAIDASQIVMMTFVNALMSIAAGNFAQLMVMPQATTYSSETLQAATEAGVTAITLASNVANAYAKLLVQIVVMVVILLLAIAFIWRIVILWIALIMAPIAGFSWGSKEIVGMLGRFYSEWMGVFVPPLVLGPMLSFFLYLALAATSNGNLAQAEAFPEPENPTTYGQVTLEVFESTNFTGLLIAVVFLLMGLQQSAKVAAKMGGLASMALNDKTGKRVLSLGARVSGATVGNVAKLGTRGALKTAGALGSGIELAGNKLGSRYGNGVVGSTLRRAGKLGGLAGAAATLADNQVRLMPTDATKLPGYAKNRGAAMAKGVSAAATAAGRGLSQGIANNVKNPHLASALNALGPNALLAAGSALHTQEHHVSEAEAKAAKDRVAHMTDAEKAMRLQQALDGTGEKSIEAFADAAHLKGMLFTDKNFENSFKAATGGNFDSHVEKMLNQFQHESDAGHLSVDKETWNKARSKYTDLYAKGNPSKAAGFIDSEDFNGRLMRSQAAADSTVLSALAAASSGKTENGKVVTKLDELSRGGYGGDLVRAAVPGAVGAIAAAQASGNTATPEGRERLSKLLERGGVAKLKVADFDSPAVIEAMINSKADKGGIAAEEVASGSVSLDTVQNTFAEKVMATQSAENIVRAFDNGQIGEHDLWFNTFDDKVNANADNVVKAVARIQKGDFSRMNNAAAVAMNEYLRKMESGGNRISSDEANEIRKKLIAAGKAIPEVISGVNPDPKTNPSMELKKDARVKMQQMFKVDPSTIRQVSKAVAVGSKNAFTDAIVESVSKEDFQKLSEAMRKETDTVKKAAIREAMRTIDEALKIYENEFAQELKKLEGERTKAATDKMRKEYERKIAEIKNGENYKTIRRSRNDYNAADRYMT